jgi:hypothetical protein
MITRRCEPWAEEPIAEEVDTAEEASAEEVDTAEEASAEEVDTAEEASAGVRVACCVAVEGKFSACGCVN